MKRLTIISRFIFVVLFAFFGVFSWAQSSLGGSGTSNDPYRIASAADWNTFAAAVNGGNNYSGKFIQLEADIPTDDEIYEGTIAVTTMAGVWSDTESERKPFSGTFRGNSKTITVSYYNDISGDYTAPFVYTNGATITNDLTVVGYITAPQGRAAGLIGINYGNKTKVNSNVTVKVNISGGDECAGIAVDGTNVEMSSCVYDGQIVVGAKSAGFCAIGDGTTKFNNCLFAPAQGSSIAKGENFMVGSFNTNSRRYYYTYNETPVVASTQGICVYESYDDVPDDGYFWVNYQLYDNNYYYVKGSGAIKGLASQYIQSNAQGGGITYDVTFDSHPTINTAVVVDPECYIADVVDKWENIIDINTIETGDYILRITGKEGYSKGVLRQDFKVIANIFEHGSGTEDDPYQIGSTSEWNDFANAVNGGYSFIGEFLKLTSDITVMVSNDESSDQIVGVMTNSGGESKWFSGTFDGDWHTIMFVVGTKIEPYIPGNNSPNSPFRVIDGATINNLRVTGAIYSTKKYNSGLVGFSYNTQSGNINYINNCTSSIVVKCNTISTVVTDCSSAGFLAENKSGKINFTNCIFDGSIDKGYALSAEKGAGFVSYNNGSEIVFTNCTMAGTITLTGKYATFNRNGKDKYNESYYITNYSGTSPQGKPALTVEPENAIVKRYTVSGTDYYVPGAVISGIEEKVYQYTGNDIEITTVVEYYGRTLVNNTDYKIILEKRNGSDYEIVSAINAAGDYHYIIRGADNYGGSNSTDIKVIQLNSWAALMEAMSQRKGTFDLTEDIVAENPLTTDEALRVKGDITLNLNGHTIDRNLDEKVEYGQVFRVESLAKLTINGPGTITGGYSWPGEGSIPGQTVYYDKRDGGGIHNMGSLVLHNVNIIDNQCEKGVAGNYIYSARGGGIYSGRGSSLVIEGGEIVNNIAPGGGGGVYSEGANPFTMTDVTVESNICESKGGGLRILTTGGAIANLTDCRIYMNMVDQDASQGAGVFLEGGELMMTRCEIMGNMASQQGAGFFSLNGKTTATDCNISYNGTYYEDPNNRGAGVCLNDNKGSYHSIFIMDGGIIESNNCTQNGGGIYVHDGAIFQVKGDVVIRDNFKAAMFVGSSSNNAYLDGSSVIEVIDDLGENAIINITPNGTGSRTYVVFAEGVSSVESLQHFAVDTDDYNIIIDEDGNIEVYEPYPWNITATWNGSIAENSSGAGTIPTETSDIKIHRAVRIPRGYVAQANSIIIDEFCDIIIEDGAELINSSANVAVMAQKNVVAADADAGTGWYLISSPVANPNIVEYTNLITDDGWNDTYDLFRFNEAAELQWENYRTGHADFTTLQNGRGYLYRNGEDHRIDIGGTLNVSDVDYNLTCAGTDALKGFHVIGNPYSHTVYKGNTTDNVHPAIPNTLLEEKYYVLNPTTGEWDLTDDGTAIAPMTGILVQAKDAGTLTITNSTEGKTVRSRNANGNNIWFTVANSSFEDKTCVEFKEGHGLNKIAHLNEEAPMLYVNHDGEDFASVNLSDNVRAFNLNFEAMTTGRYTLSVQAEGGFGYLHLLDRLTDNDIDLLKESEYEFIGSSADNAERFVVRLSPSTGSETDAETFAWQNGNDIIVEGEGELQVFDVTGRMVATQHINGVQTVNGLNNGVYIFRLEEMIQKIVVR